MNWFLISLEIMGIGLLGIFVVIGVIYFIVRILNSVTAKKPAKN